MVIEWYDGAAKLRYEEDAPEFTREMSEQVIVGYCSAPLLIGGILAFSGDGEAYPGWEDRLLNTLKRYCTSWDMEVKIEGQKPVRYSENRD